MYVRNILTDSWYTPRSGIPYQWTWCSESNHLSFKKRSTANVHPYWRHPDLRWMIHDFFRVYVKRSRHYSADRWTNRRTNRRMLPNGCLRPPCRPEQVLNKIWKVPTCEHESFLQKPVKIPKEKEQKNDISFSKKNIPTSDVLSKFPKSRLRKVSR